MVYVNICDDADPLTLPENNLYMNRNMFIFEHAHDYQILAVNFINFIL